ncbi:MAG: glutaredoxin family protein [Parcubacteria group bacterium]
MKQVTIYSTPTCHFCNMAKDYFKENNVAYEAIDVASDPEKRKEMMEKSGQLGVPVILIDNEVVVGFNKPKLARLLEIGDTSPQIS